MTKIQKLNRISTLITIIALSALLGSAVRVQAAIQAPTEINGCVLWLDAADTSTIIEADSRVVSWSDKSGNNAHVAQPDATKRPVSGVDTLNTLNVLTFDGSRWMAGPAVLEQSDKTFSMYAVWVRNTIVGVQTVVEQAKSTADIGTRASLLTVNSGGFGKYGFNGQHNDAHILAPFTANEWKVSGMIVDGRENRNVVVYDNGDHYVGTINMTLRDTGADGICVGAKYQNKAEVLNGKIAEIVIFDSVLPDTDRNAMLYYLQQKWGVECGVQDLAMLIDFEHDRLPDGWVAEGAAFENQPVCSTRKAFTKRGDWMLSTFENSKTGGNTAQGNVATGTLTGASFVLNSNTIRARMGGGYLVATNNECLLMLEQQVAPDEWQVVRKASGADDDLNLRDTCWNVHNLLGETVRFKVVDNVSGTWGQLIVDDIRVFDQPLTRSFHTDFSGTELVPELQVLRPFVLPEVGLSGNETLKFKLMSSTHNEWDYVARAPKVVLNTIDNDIFTLETHMVSRSYTNNYNMAGLILVFEDPDANSFDSIMFGAHESGIVVEGPSVVRTNALAGVHSDVYLRINGHGDRFTYAYSQDGTVWTTIRIDHLPDKMLLQAGVFCKDWIRPSALEVEFDYLSYQAKPLPFGTVLMVK